MDINAAFPGEFLKAADLQGRQAAVVIDRVEMQKVGDDHKPVAYFQGKDRGLVLNKTNANIIADMYGSETNQWVGQRIVLYSARVEYQGKLVDAIRVQHPSAAQAWMPPQAPPPPPPPVPSNKVLDDEIPF